MDVPPQAAAAPPPPPPPPPAPPAAPPRPPVQERAPQQARPVAAPVRQPEPQPEPAPEPEPAHDPLPDPPPQPTEDVAPPPVIEAHAYGDDGPSHFDPEPPFRPRRNPLKMWTWAAVIFAVLAIGTVLAVSYRGLPDWVPVERPTFGADHPDLQLDFPDGEQERRTLPNETEYFGASGRITNIGTETRTIPTILIVLRDSRDTIVYQWEVPPPQTSLAPGETVTIRAAVTDVPRRARVAEIGWKPE